MANYQHTWAKIWQPQQTLIEITMILIIFGICFNLSQPYAKYLSMWIYQMAACVIVKDLESMVLLCQPLHMNPS